MISTTSTTTLTVVGKQHSYYHHQQQHQHPPKQQRIVLFPLLIGSLLLVTCITTLYQSRQIVFHDDAHPPQQDSVVNLALESFVQQPQQQSKHKNQDEDDDDTTTNAAAQQQQQGQSTAALDQASSSSSSLFSYANPPAAIANIGPIPDGYDTFSACLLVMDDNHRLPEWLAYHYHVLPLRFLIIAVDPRSRTSPRHILNQWRNMSNHNHNHDNMHIIEWDDHHFLNPQLASNIIPDDAPLQNKRDRHRSRQKNFYRECLIQMQQTYNRTYTMLIDTDEFLTYNHAGGDQATFEQWEQWQLQRHLQSTFASKPRIRPSSIPPSTAQAGSMIHYLRREERAGHVSLQTPCISVPRLQFGAVESTPAERNHKVPSEFWDQSERLDTLRYRKHAHRSDFVKNGLSKCIIDVSRMSHNIPKIDSLHRPIKTICGAPWVDEWKTLLRIHHYLGSWESYSYRNDARRGGERSREGWEFRASDADETDDAILRPWFASFVQTHGIQTTRELLMKYAGLPKSYKNPNETAWTIMFLKEILGRNDSSTHGNDSRRSFDGFVRKRYGLNP